MVISVITPVFNGERYLSQSIESVLNQKGNFEIEYLIYDGNSSDHSIDIINLYHERFLDGEFNSNCNGIEFSYISENDNGMYDALRKGFINCTGDIICWINADDYLLEGCFQKVSEIFQQHEEVNWICGKCNIVDKYKKVMYSPDLRYYPQELILNGGFGLYTGYFIPQENTFWRRSLLENIDMDIFASYKLAGDFYLWYQFAKKNKLISVAETFAAFRKTDCNLSGNRKAYLNEMQEIIGYKSSFGYRDKVWLQGHCCLEDNAANKKKNRFPYLNYDEEVSEWTMLNKERKKGKKKKLSIITICYNDLNIKYTCESIVSQTWNNYEWIIVDGGSNSDTLEIIDKYKDRIDILISEPDSGIYNAMNKGIAMAHGEWLIFMNGGDQFYNAKVLENVFRSREYDAEVLYGDEERNDENGQTYIYRVPYNIPPYFMCYQSFAHQAMFYRRRLFETFGGYDESYEISADSEKNTQLLENNVKFKKIMLIVSAHALDGISINKEHIKKQIEEKNRRRLKYYDKETVDLYSCGVKSSQVSIPIITIRSYRNGQIKKYYLFGKILLFTAKRAF